jgi:hypothetical protein
VFSRSDDGETRNRDYSVKIGGGNAAKVTPRRFFTLSAVNTIITVMKRE